jgi:hypothetical protein
LVFTDLLGRMTAAQARIVKFMCERVEKGRTKQGLLVPISTLLAPVAGALKIAELDDLQQLDRDLDHLRALGLSGGGLDVAESTIEGDSPPPVNLTPTALALQMYARCQGVRDPLAFYGLLDAEPVKLISVRGLGGAGTVVIRPERK